MSAAKAAPRSNRCRLVLIAPDLADPNDFGAAMRSAVEGGDIASVILPSHGREADAFQRLCEKVVPFLQERGVAVMVEGDSRIAGRMQADGIHVEGGRADIAEAIERAEGRVMVGANGGKSRDDALQIGELRPDYVFFGRIGYDNTQAPHPRNLVLGQWWAELIQLPCIVLGGSAVASVETVAATGADFVALSAAIFSGGDPKAEVARANAILDETAPRLDG